MFCLSFLAGCETDGFVDPSRTGYFETTPSAMPILGRIDVIEQASEEPEFVPPTLADLKTEDQPYTFAAGDVLQISIPNLLQTGATEQADRIVDQSGYVQLPVIGKVLAGGLDTVELEESIVKLLKPVMGEAKVFVMLKEGRSFQYRVLGSVDQPGIFGLTRPDFRLLDAIATARGASVNTTRILITRTKLDTDQIALYDKTAKDKKDAAIEKQKRDAGKTPATNNPETNTKTNSNSNPAANSSETSTNTKSTNIPSDTDSDIDNLIKEVDNKGGAASASEPSAAPASEPSAAPASEPSAAPANEPSAAPASEPSAAPASEPSAAPASEPSAAPASEPSAAPANEPSAAPANEPSAAPPVADPATEPTRLRTQLGMLRAATRQAPPVDVDHLELAKSDDRVDGTDNSTAISNSPNDNAGYQWVFDNVSQSWERKSSTDATASQTNTQLRVAENAQARKAIRKKNKLKESTTVIEINYGALVKGDPKLNIVIRPGDAIYCDSGEIGVVYIDGEISRPGVYNLPTAGRLTLSRLVAAAGGVSELAIPERCDLIRRLGSDKEACVRVSLAAIRNRGEPDIFLKPDDHLIVGTNFWALPLARFRRDLSFPNSVGFQLDRNFGNDVFGAPPQDINGIN